MHLPPEKPESSYYSGSYHYSVFVLVAWIGAFLGEDGCEPWGRIGIQPTEVVGIGTESNWRCLNIESESEQDSRIFTSNIMSQSPIFTSSPVKFPTIICESENMRIVCLPTVP